MLKNIIQLLRMYDFHGESEIIEQAKGGNKYPSTFRDAFKLCKRQLAMKNQQNGN